MPHDMFMFTTRITEIPISKMLNSLCLLKSISQKLNEYYVSRFREMVFIASLGTRLDYLKMIYFEKVLNPFVCFTH